ncbi:hypothetical protein [Acinetobacter sp. NIPH 298]|uniref:hypothetical protein n=1 Tax=Acinetobacter sp. NIPH 298 TaxID=1217692 RepID=UPI0002CFEEAC|nr:hypothetical protein [Acinetobacter sp. NIPH 298]ENW93593.1 hypothetical protein F903_03015 [Acinetobacter sp. NIPH 298]
MNNQYFEGLNQKVKQILEYLDSKSNEEIGAIFSREISDRTKIDLNGYGEQVKRSFKMIDQRHDYIIQILKALDDQEKQFFYDISVDAQEQMRVNLRTISRYIPDLESVYSSNGGINDLFNIDQSFRNTYEAFIVYARIAKISLVNLNKKIAEDLNPSFKSKNSQVDQLIAELKIYKGEASSRKTKEIYKKKYEDYKRTVEIYEFYIMLLVCLSVTLVLGQLFAHSFFDALNLSNAITIKLTIFALIATLFTYCFKQISFYRKISEQAHQTYMELEALPEYLIHLPDNKQHEIRFDLAKRYFGQSLFESIKEDSISIQEQAKTNAEVLKSTSTLLDVIKKQNN